MSAARTECLDHEGQLGYDEMALPKCSQSKQMNCGRAEGHWLTREWRSKSATEALFEAALI